MKIISISGLDGSGKSTQIQSIQKELEGRGHKVFYFHAITFSIANMLTAGKKVSQGGKKIDVTQASWSAIQLRKFALMIDLLRFRMLVLQLTRKGYDFILSDRYFFDMVINIAYLSHKKYMPFFLRMMIMPDHVFFLSIDPQKIMQRTDTPEQGLHYLMEKNTLYNAYKDLFKFTIITGDRDRSAITADILSPVLYEK